RPRATLFPYTTLFRSKGILPSHSRRRRHRPRLSRDANPTTHKNWRHVDFSGFHAAAGGDWDSGGGVVAAAHLWIGLATRSKCRQDRKSTRLNSSHRTI